MFQISFVEKVWIELIWCHTAHKYKYKSIIDIHFKYINLSHLRKDSVVCRERHNLVLLKHLLSLTHSQLSEVSTILAALALKGYLRGQCVPSRSHRLRFRLEAQNSFHCPPGLLRPLCRRKQISSTVGRLTFC